MPYDDGDDSRLERPRRIWPWIVTLVGMLVVVAAVATVMPNHEPADGSAPTGGAPRASMGITPK